MKLYIYDHCPYCVKARMIFGLKKIPFKLAALLNDDEKTPQKMIGLKQVPILELSQGKFMPESLDIIRHIDGPAPPNAVHSWKDDPKLTAWLNSTHFLIYSLAMPRWVKAPLAEFKTSSARSYFQNKKEKSIGPFSQALKNSQKLKKEAQSHLKALEALFPKKQSFFKGDLTINDFHLWPALRSLSIVKGLLFPPKIRFYMDNLACKSGIPLHYSIAL